MKIGETVKRVIGWSLVGWHITTLKIRISLNTDGINRFLFNASTINEIK